ncbi:MAG TPA: hypothetical protein VF066_07970, partial [Thermoleophilaceae bacterium]
ESTVQTTTQAVAPQPAVAPQTQTSAPAPTKRTATRVAAPVKKHVAAVARPRTQARPAAAPTQLAKSGGAAAEPVRTVAAKRTRVARTHVVSTPARTKTAGAQDMPADCALPALPLPGELQALLAIVCDATGGLDLTARLGLAHADSGTPALGDVRGASARSAGGPVHARSAARVPRALAGIASRTSPGSGTPLPIGAPVGPPTGAGGGHGAGIADWNAMGVAQATPQSGGGGANGASSHHHHGFFSGQSRGTEILLAIIFANLSILGGIALWRLAARWVIPRWA